MKSPLGVFIQIGCGILFFMGLFACSTVLFFSKAQSDKFWQTGVHVDGVVLRIEAETQKHKNGNQTIVSEKVQFEYLIEGQIFRDWGSFGYDTSFYIGQSVPVIYDPHEPWNAQIIAEAPPFDPRFGVVIGGLVVIGIIFYRLQNPPEKQKRKNEEKHSLL